MTSGDHLEPGGEAVGVEGVLARQPAVGLAWATEYDGGDDAALIV